MGLKSNLDLIRDTLSNGLPALLTSANLDDFESYLSIPDNDSGKRQLVVYPDRNNNATDNLTTGFIIKAQLPRVADNASYFDVIEPFIRKNITPELLGYVNRVSIDSDFFPIDLDRSTSYIFFNIIYSSELDDCED